MADDQDKSAARGAKQPVDKQQARRERQAQSLRQNLARRKAQMRGLRESETGPSSETGNGDEPS